MLRKMRSVHLIMAILMLAVPASAYALTSTNALAGSVSDTQSIVNLQLTPRRTSYDHPVTVTGRAPRSATGRAVVLQTATSPGGNWRPLAVTRVGPEGTFRLRAALRRSGLLRVADGQATSPVAGRSATAVAADGSELAASSPLPVTVAARLQVAPGAHNVLGNQGLAVKGKLLPAVAHRPIGLQGHFADGWRTLATARTAANGNFKLHGQLVSGMQRPLRVTFAGDRVNAGTTRSAGQATVYGQSVASWYDDAGSTACGFHAGLGVANVSLPCGTKVRFFHAGHSVTAVVDDRGPYVGGRQWDLNQNTAGALGFSGVGTVWVSQ
jgi:hypothetical protein